MTMHTRGQAISIARLFLALIGGAIVIFIVGKVTSPLLSRAQNGTANGSTYAQGTTWLSQGIDTLPLAFLLISLFGIVAGSVFLREALR